MPIDTPSGAYELGAKKRKLPRTLVGGTTAMIEAGEELTPRHAAEELQTYNARLKGTTLFNGYNDAVKKSVGKVFSKDIGINADVPPVLAEYMLNVDGQGRNLTAFSLDVFRESMHDGVSFIFVDFPVVQRIDGTEPTLADQLEIKARPNAILYKADQVISYKHENHGGQEILTELRVAIDTTEISEKDEFEEVDVRLVKLYKPGSAETFKSNDGEWISDGGKQTSLSYIPIVAIYTNRTGYFEGEPTHAALAELNLEHWISSSEQRRALTFARFPMRVVSGVDAESNVTLGPDQVLTLPNPDAKASILETTGRGIEAGRLDLEAIENKMQHTGMSIQVQNTSGNVTATAVNANSSEGNSALMAAAVALNDGLNQMLQIFADYSKINEGGTVSVNNQFGRIPSKMSYEDMVKMYDIGVMDEVMIWNEMKARGDLRQDEDLEDIAARLREKTPLLRGAPEL